MESITPKRKTRKQKDVLTLAHIEKMVSKLDVSKAPQPKKSANEVFTDIYSHGYKENLVYIYYSHTTRCNIQDILTYIQKVQIALDNFKVGTQIQLIMDIEKPEVRLNNCYICRDEPTDWTMLATNQSSFCVRIKELPNVEISELIKLIKSCEKFDNDYFEMKYV